MFSFRSWQLTTGLVNGHCCLSCQLDGEKQLVSMTFLCWYHHDDDINRTTHLRREAKQLSSLAIKEWLAEHLSQIFLKTLRRKRRQLTKVSEEGIKLLREGENVVGRVKTMSRYVLENIRKEDVGAGNNDKSITQLSKRREDLSSPWDYLCAPQVFKPVCFQWQAHCWSTNFFASRWGLQQSAQCC